MRHARGHLGSDQICAARNRRRYRMPHTRCGNWTVQTPQAFPVAMLRKAYAAVEAENKDVFDDAQAVEIVGETVKICESDKPNIKITTPEDIQVAAAILKL